MINLIRIYSKSKLTKEIFKIIKNKQHNLKNKEIYLKLLKPMHNKRKLKSKKIEELEKDVKLLLSDSHKFIKTRS